MSTTSWQSISCKSQTALIIRLFLSRCHSKLMHTWQIVVGSISSQRPETYFIMLTLLLKVAYQPTLILCTTLKNTVLPYKTQRDSFTMSFTGSDRYTTKHFWSTMRGIIWSDIQIMKQTLSEATHEYTTTMYLLTEGLARNWEISLDICGAVKNKAKNYMFTLIQTWKL